MTMRVTPGKIYGFGFAFMVATTVWNRYSNKGLMERVEGVKQEKLRQAAELRSTTTGDDKR
ncbi:transmembrane protein, putative [Bodo saltans]|uniref:Transmembrane protein, putative n=1 Tax=Bodo saltans TaxID=75058 RepID=A0A0S4JD12_BODSA|nr:transmembrane protein, putative [Bodo saltans]|eukprot:CUG89362.1 transmembrane protein, putative [Bodo saltans]